MRYSWLILLFLNLFSMPSYSAGNSINAGTIIKVRMSESINGQDNNVGDYFNVTILDNIKIDQKIVIQSGSAAKAMINKIQPPGRGQQTPRFILTLATIRVNNHCVSISTFPITQAGTQIVQKKTAKGDKLERKSTTGTAAPMTGYAINLAVGTTLSFTLKGTLLEDII